MKYLFTIAAAFIFLRTYSQNSIVGRTTGRLPYLEYGLGEDRLGGAKMTYLDTGIIVKVTDSTKDNYKVQLSARHAAYLPKQNFKRDTIITIPSYYLTSSWKVGGGEKYDTVSIILPERLPYRSVQQIDPATIVIDIFGATSNTNWITQLNTAKEIKNVWYEQPEDDVFRIFIQLNHPQHWGYFIFYKNHTLIVRVKRRPVSLKPKNLLVAIDAGHGGSNTGASGIVSKVQEKEYTLKIAREVEKYLGRKYFHTYATRTHDTDISMIDRTLMLRQQEPDFLISIHLNSSGNAAVKGVSTYYRYVGFRPLTQYILARMLQLGLNNFGNIGAFNFPLSGPSEYPNCLVEVAFLSNAEDEQRILQKRFHKAVAKQIYKGIRDWLRSMR